MNSNLIKDRIKKIFELKNETINSFSKKCDLNQRTINRHVNEETTVGYDIIYAIASVYPDISMHWLITGDGDMTNQCREDSLNKANVIIEMKLSEDDLLNLNLQKQIKKII
jgi:hypothetical protein